MALDGAFLYLTAQEMRSVLIGTRVEKIAQPSKEELVLTFRLRGGSRKVLFSANAASPPAVHETAIAHAARTPTIDFFTFPITYPPVFFKAFCFIVLYQYSE